MKSVWLIFLTCLTVCQVIASYRSSNLGLDGQEPSNDAIIRQVLTHLTRNDNYYDNLILNSGMDNLQQTGETTETNNHDELDTPIQNPIKAIDLSDNKVENNSTDINTFKEKMAKLNEKSIQTKDHEHLDQSSLWGNQYISGGAGEGEQHLGPNGDKNNQQEIKTDPVLPGYCNPPNPCPKGYTAKDGCQENIPDTAAFNRRYNYMQLVRGSCSCDSEHMFNCPEGYDKIGGSQQTDYEANDPVDVLVERLLSGNNEEKENPYARGVKRSSLVAKKFRIKRAVSNEGKAVPYLSAGEKHIIVAKKGRAYMQRKTHQKQ